MHCVLVLNALRFGAKYTAFWCKMHCVLVQNTLRFGAKHKAKWCKTQGEKHDYPQQWYKYNLLEPLKTWSKSSK